jgi:hypothetical protein
MMSDVLVLTRSLSSRTRANRPKRANRGRLVAFAVLVLFAASALASCGTPRCTLKGCGFDSNF